MFSYVMLGTNDLPRAIRFYDPLMELLGHPKAGRNEEGASWGTFSNNQGFHSAYVRDPDGNKLAFVFYADEG